MLVIVTEEQQSQRFLGQTTTITAWDRTRHGRRSWAPSSLLLSPSAIPRQTIRAPRPPRSRGSGHSYALTRTSATHSPASTSAVVSSWRRHCPSLSFLAPSSVAGLQILNNLPPSIEPARFHHPACSVRTVAHHRRRRVVAVGIAVVACLVVLTR